MTWNVENLFPPGYQMSPQKAVSQADYDAKLDYLAQRILEVAPDVLALQEIGGRSKADTQSLDDLQSRLQNNYPFKALSQHPDGRKIRVGFLSRLEIIQPNDLVEFAPGELSQVSNWASKPPIKEMGRGALKIEVEPVPGMRVRLITVHLKSKLISYPTTGSGTRFNPKDENERTIGEGLALLRRTAEAATVRMYLNTLVESDRKTHTIVLGDLNDEPRAATSQLLMGPEDADVTSDDKNDKVRLYNLIDSIPRQGDETNDKWFLPEAERFSRIYKGQYELIDHILVSKGLLGATADLRQDRWQVTEVRSLVDSIRGESIGDNPVERVGKNRPDHAPIYVRFRL